MEAQEKPDLEFAGFKTVIDTEKSNSKETVFRAFIKNKEEADLWLADYSKITKSQWIVKETFPNHTRLVYRKLYVCSFSAKNKNLPEGSKRNWGCTANLDIKIKLLTKETKKRDGFLKGEEPLQGVVTVSQIHPTHNTENFSAMRCFRAGNDLRQQFMEYFHEGSSPAQALALHASKISILEDGREKRGDGHYMPLNQTVYYWHRIYRQLHYGPPNSPFETLKKKIDVYKEHGVTVVVQEESPWAVLVVSPVMKRAQDLFWSKNIVFVDTSSSCDSTSTNVTLMLTATKAGAVPMAVLLHEGQSADSYRVTFQLLKTTFPTAFGGETHPLVFMSDNSSAEKKALNLVWPESIQLLCGFHVGQAEWDWIHSNVVKEHRKILMKAFQQIQYANSCVELEEKIDALKEISEDYFERRVKGLLDNKQEWVQLFRADLPIGGHHTNNYAEASIRVLKDIILERTKAFNIVALVDYIAVTWEKYLETRLSWYAYDRVSRPENLYADLVKRMSPELSKQIECLDDGLYLVPSGRENDLKYEVQATLGMCSCKAGAAGAFCKHQALVHSTYGGVFPNCPPITSADRYLLGKLAMGEECPKKTFFLGMRDTLEDLEEQITQLQSLYSLPADGSSRSQESLHQQSDHNDAIDHQTLSSPADDEEQNLVSAEESAKHQKEFLDNINRIFKLGSESNSSGFHKFMARANKGMREIQNSNKAFEAMMKLATVLKSNSSRSGKRINVLPKSVARRRPGLTKGNHRVASGRPCKLLKAKATRKRQLASSIAASQRHIKKH